jgi:hypothetical protein
MSALRLPGWSFLRGTLRASVALLLCAAMVGVFQADTAVFDPSSGRVIYVEVVDDPENQGLIYNEQTTQGQTSSEPIDFTIDPVIDDSPALALNPSGGVVMVWSRNDGGDSELMLSRRENGYWTQPLALTNNTKFDTEARVLVGAQDIAHVVWWGDGEEGPFYIRSFNILTGQPTGPRQEPLWTPRTTPRPLRQGGTGYDEAGGMDEPGIPSSTGNLATAIPCLENPDAAPVHGLVMSCGQPAAYQLSACQLIVGVRDPATLSWRQTIANLTTVPLSTTPVTAIVQAIADSECALP